MAKHYPNIPSFLTTLFIRVCSFSTQKSKSGVKFSPAPHSCDRGYQFLLVDLFFPSLLEHSVCIWMTLNVLPSQILNVISSNDLCLHSVTHWQKSHLTIATIKITFFPISRFEITFLWTALFIFSSYLPLRFWLRRFLTFRFLALSWFITPISMSCPFLSILNHPSVI